MPALFFFYTVCILHSNKGVVSLLAGSGIILYLGGT